MSLGQTKAPVGKITSEGFGIGERNRSQPLLLLKTKGATWQPLGPLLKVKLLVGYI